MKRYLLAITCTDIATMLFEVPVRIAGHLAFFPLALNHEASIPVYGMFCSLLYCSVQMSLQNT